MKMAQFRNIIVHDYARLDAEIIWGILKRDLGDLKHFMLTIKNYWVLANGATVAVIFFRFMFYVNTNRYGEPAGRLAPGGACGPYGYRRLRRGPDRLRGGLEGSGNGTG
jgi:hypothetical protein